MKHSAMRLLSVLLALAMVFSLLPGFALAVEGEVLVAEGSASFATDIEAFNGQSELFTPETNGTVTVEILECDPGYYVDVYQGLEWVDEYAGTAADTVVFPVSAGFAYEIVLCSYNASNPSLGYAQAGSIRYKITFLSSGEGSGGGEEPEDPSLIPGATPENPKPVTGSQWDYIGAGKTLWYQYDNRENMEQNGVYSMMLHIISSADYAVTYAGQSVPVDENGFVNFEMEDTDKTGLYLFSITNNGSEEKFFSMEVKKRPVYVISGLSLAETRNTVTLDDTAPYTLYEFTPTRTGVYQFRVAQGTISNWGSVYNPINTTTDKINTLTWTCTAVGQSVMVGFSGPKSTTCTVIRTGEYIPPVVIEWNFYENTYDFSYQLDANAEIVDVDLTDGGNHTAVLGEDGFYHYGSAEGPLMVTDLTAVEINISDAYVNGGLRAWLLDENGDTISKNDYNEALNAYYNAGLVPVTQELAMMLQEVGQASGWWISGSLIFPAEAPEDLSMAWMQLCGYLAEPETATLTGRVETGAEGDATIELIADGVVATATASGQNSAYVIENVAAGTYTLRVSKKNHVTREYTVTVGEEDLVQDVKIHLIGDIDGNGRINVGDAGKVYSHMKKKALITDEYMLLCADVSGDGRINVGDVGRIYSHIKSASLLW